MGTVRLLFLVFASCCWCCTASDWYVRPGIWSTLGSGCNPVPVEGLYGTQNGTSYENAWNGLRQIVWGGAGVVAGDTVWICGAHVVRQSTTTCYTIGVVPVTASGTDVSQITIRMDYGPDPGEVFGLWKDDRVSWTGPDGNGVYQMTGNGVGLNVFRVFMETDGPPTVGCDIMLLTNKNPSVTWTTGVGAAYHTGSGNTNFVKPFFTPGGSISTNVFGTGGYTFDLTTSSNITFLNCRFSGGSYPTATANGDGSLSANKITFRNCNFRYNYTLWIRPGWDDWTFDGCSFSVAENGIYTSLDTLSHGANRLTVTNCTFSDIGWGRTGGAVADGYFLHNDSHGVGVQGGVGHVIEHNSFSRTGTAIEFWTEYQDMTNHIVRYNWISDIYICPVTAGHGIAVSGSNTDYGTGYRTGFKIYGNVMMNLGLNGDEDYQGSGVSSNNRDPMEVFHNTVSNCIVGYRHEVTIYPVQGLYENNIVVSPSLYNMRVVGVGATTLTADYNLFYPSPNSSDKFSLSPSFTHDANSVFGQDPKFVSATPDEALDFALQSTSPAIGAGTALTDWTVDFRGAQVLNPPAIGAFGSSRLIQATTIRVGTLRGTP